MHGVMIQHTSLGLQDRGVVQSEQTRRLGGKILAQAHCVPCVGMTLQGLRLQVSTSVESGLYSNSQGSTLWDCQGGIGTMDMDRGRTPMRGCEEFSMMCFDMMCFGTMPFGTMCSGMMCYDVNVLRHNVNVLRHDVLWHDVNVLWHDVDVLRHNVNVPWHDVNVLWHDNSMM